MMNADWNYCPLQLNFYFLLFIRFRYLSSSVNFIHSYFGLQTIYNTIDKEKKIAKWKSNWEKKCLITKIKNSWMSKWNVMFFFLWFIFFFFVTNWFFCAWLNEFFLISCSTPKTSKHLLPLVFFIFNAHDKIYFLFQLLATLSNIDCMNEKKMMQNRTYVNWIVNCFVCFVSTMCKMISIVLPWLFLLLLLFPFRVDCLSPLA